MSLYRKLMMLFFGEGLPIQQREPGLVRKSEVWMTYAGAAFLIIVATYIPMVAVRDLKYLEDRKTAVLERCVIETGDFTWCWKQLTN